ncbi:DUF3048 domain-containing protein [uncultured Metabacillus sp.]|uniref:DUF3048 domain-containing protein n=1 Tax=uncultured Metabacillus sp. TaxID=2860135 RepID=UPI0026227955|nr:DUF3048 domain-containing protein [uncultured Metabacillus sp.]
MDKKKFSYALITMLMVISACSNKEEARPVKNEETVQQEEKPVTAEEEEVSVYPLTGLEAEGELNQRPVAVMINNHPTARPQSGLHKADIVYEVLAEGSITRFLAVFQSEIPDTIGPVRSARDYYIDLSEGFDALFISHGWSPDAQEKLESGEADYLNGLFYDGTLFWRADHRKAPHNSYISYENILKGAKSNKYETTADVEPLAFLSEEEVVNLKGEPASKFVIKYDKSETWNVTYEYNQTKQSYSRFSDNEQTVDLESEEPIQLTNVFVVEMEHTFIDSYGRRSIDLTSGGKAILFQNGQMKEVKWENRNGRILPVKDGEVLKLVPGKTWVNIVPNIEDAFVIQTQ